MFFQSLFVVILLSISNGNAVTLVVDDADASTTNELNTGFLVNGGNLELTDAGGTLSVPLSTLAPNDGDWTVIGSDITSAVTGHVGIGVISNFDPGSYQLTSTLSSSKALTVSANPSGSGLNRIASLVLEGTSNVVGYEIGVIDFVNAGYNFARIATTKQNTKRNYSFFGYFRNKKS